MFCTLTWKEKARMLKWPEQHWRGMKREPQRCVMILTIGGIKQRTWDRWWRIWYRKAYSLQTIERLSARMGESNATKDKLRQRWQAKQVDHQKCAALLQTAQAQVVELARALRRESIRQHNYRIYTWAGSGLWSQMLPSGWALMVICFCKT